MMILIFAAASLIVVPEPPTEAPPVVSAAIDPTNENELPGTAPFKKAKLRENTALVPLMTPSVAADNA
jgi:hypothetical protein